VAALEAAAALVEAVVALVAVALRETGEGGQ